MTGRMPLFSFLCISVVGHRTTRAQTDCLIIQKSFLLPPQGEHKTQTHIVVKTEVPLILSIELFLREDMLIVMVHNLWIIMKVTKLNQFS